VVPAVEEYAASFFCAQAPKLKALAKTATIIIIFKNFNLSRLLSQQVAAYFPVLLGTGVTTSLFCAQAPSPKAVTSTATVMINFNNFTLFLLLS
jgi:hypothetical protein